MGDAGEEDPDREAGEREGVLEVLPECVEKFDMLSSGANEGKK
jgi:hypothetical protein